MMKIPHLLLCVGLGVVGTGVLADPLAEARTLLQQNKPEEVESVLAPFFEEDEPQIEALKLSFRVARQTGNVYTAERRVRELISQVGTKEPEWIFEGAKVALDLGQTARGMDRLMYFVRQSKEKSPQLEEALQLLSQHSTFPEAFEAYVNQYPEQAQFGVGMRMMERIRRESQPQTFLDMGRLLLKNFTKEGQVDQVHQEIYEAVDQNMLGLNRDQAYDAMFSGTIHGYDIIGNMINRRGIRYEELLKLQKAAGGPLPSWILARFDGLDNIRSPELKAALSKEFLSFEPLYRKTGNAALYRGYMNRVFSEPNAFIPKSGRVISEKMAEDMFRTAVKMHKPADLHQMRYLGRMLVGEHRNIPNRFVQDPERRKALLQEFHPAFDGNDLQQLVHLSQDQGKAVTALVQLTQGRQDVRRMLLEEMNRANLGDLLASTAGRELLLNPTSFDTRLLAREFINSKTLQDAQKVAVLEKVLAETGYTRRLIQLLDHKDSRLRDHPPLQAFRKKLSADATPKDKVLALLVEIESNNKLRSGNEPRKEFTQKVEEAFDAYGTPYPVKGGSAARDAWMERILSLYRKTSGNRTQGRQIYAKTVGPRLSKDANWSSFLKFTVQDSRHDGQATHYAAKSALNAGLPYDEMFSRAWHPSSDTKPFLRPYYAKMTLDQVKGYLQRNRGQFPPEILAAEVVEAMKHHTLVAGDSKPMAEVLGRLREQKEKNKSLNLPLDAIADGVLIADQGRMLSNWEVRRELQRLYRHSGKATEGMVRLTDALKNVSDPVDRANILISAMTSDRDNVPGGSYKEDLQPGTKVHLILKELLPSVKSMSEQERGALSINEELVKQVNWYLAQREMPENRKKEFLEFRSYMAYALADGASGNPRWTEVGWSIDDAIKMAEGAGDVQQVVSLVTYTGGKAQNTDAARINEVITVLEENKRMELLLLLTQLIQTNDPAAKTRLNQARAVAGAEVQGIYPVDKGDPEYPLFVAADELARNNAEQAWNLLREHLDVFAEDPVQYPQEFTGWALEKLREVKGENGQFLELSSEIGNRVLSREDEITGDLKARAMLNRAEIFRENQDFEAARLEYKTLRTNPDLQKTPYGRQAMFRDVDLMISMGNSSAAEGLIEYWLSNPDPELQVKAYYFRALMAFNDSDYEVTRENLDKVFELDFTNTEARLLHGKWRLRTNYEVDNPEVLLGTLQDRTILRPGQPLRVSVQDPNLSVVGGGTAIPVVIKTSVGGDVEKLNLFPSTRDPRLFRGSMDTKLAVASPDNQLLEINGQDVVSYEIDPEFLALRGMTSAGEKRLTVVDDARLAVSAGEILSEAEQQAMEVESQMSGGPVEVNTTVSHVRPGNPFYVMVRDRDRSDGSEDNEVRITATTSSGDEIRGVSLKEISPFTGEFRGKIETALPPPRASASDSAEGVDPGVVINNTRDGMWRSRSDGQQGKWIKADTMNSHEVKRVMLMTPDASKIAQIRLYGSLMGEEMLMGSFPERKVSSGGVKVQTTGTNLRSLVEYRKYFSELQGTPKSVPDFTYKVTEHGKRFHVQGAFWLPEEKNLRLRLMPLENHRYNLSDLWLDILVDGERVVGGRGSDLMKNPIYVSLSQGGHVLEAFGYARHNKDGFQLGMEQADGSVVPLPADWFSIEAQPELAEFLKDRARIDRKADSWEAVFQEPERLRSIRWEFVNYAGDSIRVSEIRIEEENGKPILPSGTDYTDALKNDTLEIAPGDRISVTYEDRVTSEGQRKQLTRQLTSQFTNGNLSFFFEVLTPSDKGMRQSLYDAFRFRPGDEFMVVVQDGDLDVSPGVDTVEVEVKTRSGEMLVLTAQEQTSANHSPGTPVHSGRFLALLRTAQDAETGGDTLRVQTGDKITATYLDQENTSPGIPIRRETELSSVQESEPVLTLYHTWREQVEDTSDEAQMKLEQIRKRTGNSELEAIMTWSEYGMPMSEETLSEETISINADTPLPLEVYLPSQAMHRGSALTLVVLAESEKIRADAEGREPNVIRRRVGLGGAGGNVRMQANPEIEELSMTEPEPNATFGTSVSFKLGSPSALEEQRDQIFVQGNDKILLVLMDAEKNRIFEKQFQLVSEGSIALKDSSYEAGRTKIHLGERFFVQVQDTDQDISPEVDEITVEVQTSIHGKTTELALRETMPHSGVFTGVLLPRFLQPEVPEEAPAPAAGVEEEVEETGSEEILEVNEALVGIPTLEVAFGEQLTFTYQDAVTLPIRTPGPKDVVGRIFEGSDGEMLAFTKYFPDAEMAVRVQFRLAESLFEMAKDYRKLKQTQRSSDAIAEGKRILEEALINYPDTALAVEGEYLLANLYQEMAAEVEETDEEKSRGFYQEALSRFSAILSGYPDSDFAARAQFHKALCLEKLGDFMLASEEYVKMTYIFPESPLVGDAAIRLATHYYKNEQRYDTAGKIYSNFFRRFPEHPLAPKALFMGAQSHMKQGEIWEQERRGQGVREDDVKTERILDEYRDAVESLQELIDNETGVVTKEMRAQAMYWAGDASLRAEDYPNAYLFLKRTTFEYPDSEWARRARGLLLQSAESFEGLQ